MSPCLVSALTLQAHHLKMTENENIHHKQDSNPQKKCWGYCVFKKRRSDDVKLNEMEKTQTFSFTKR